MAGCLAAPSHCLNQCWLTILEVQWHLAEGNCTGNTLEVVWWHSLRQKLQVDCIITQWHHFSVHYSPINFLQNTHNSYPIAHPHRWAMDCLLWVASLIYILPLPVLSDHGYGLSQWEATSNCNVVSHWLSPYRVLCCMQHCVVVPCAVSKAPLYHNTDIILAIYSLIQVSFQSKSSIIFSWYCFIFQVVSQFCF